MEFTSKNRSLFRSKTEAKYEHEMYGPKNTVKTEGHSGAATFSNTFDYYGPKLNYKLDQSNGKSADLVVASSSSGLKTTAKAGAEFNLSSEHVIMKSLSGETEKAKVELKSNGEVMIQGSGKVTLSAGSGGLKAVVTNGNTTKIGDLVIKQ